MGRLLAARHDSALVFVPGGRGAALLRSPAAWPRAARSARCGRTPSGVRFCWSRWASSCGRCTPRATYFTFEDTLTQIGLGYPFLFLLGFRKPRWQWTALAAILTGYWLAWALYPVPGPDSTGSPWACPPTGTHTLLGLRRALEQERQLGQRLRSVVSEPVPARAPVRL